MPQSQPSVVNCTNRACLPSFDTSSAGLVLSCSRISILAFLEQSSSLSLVSQTFKPSKSVSRVSENLILAERRRIARPRPCFSPFSPRFATNLCRVAIRTPQIFLDCTAALRAKEFFHAKVDPASVLPSCCDQGVRKAWQWLWTRDSKTLAMGAILAVEVVEVQRP